MAHSVSVTRDGLLIDGRPLFLLSGCIHYFRYPRAEWEHLLGQARWAGLNAVDTVIPWNRHQPRPGELDFAAEADLAAFLDLCAQYGLYAIVRPGPYICAEWENGGIPAWLSGQPGIRLRVDDPAYLAATMRWFDTLMPILAPRQATRGGPIILCQIENEHWASGFYGHDFHQATLARAAAERGIEVPQYTCMGGLPGYPEFRNGWSGIAEKLQQTRATWPENPLIVSELWSGWFDSWGASRHGRKTAAKLDITLHQLTAVGASGLSHWMWAGGTSFGYWGGRTVGGDGVYMTTSYDYDAPIGEYGELRPKARAARRHHLFLGSLGSRLAPVLADAVSGGPRVIGPPAVQGRSAGGGSVYRAVRAAPNTPPAWRDFTATYLHNPTAEGITFQVFLAEPARHLVVAVEPVSMKPVFSNLPLDAEGRLTLSYHTGRILGFWQDGSGDTLAIYGQPGEVGELELRIAAGSWDLPAQAAGNGSQIGTDEHGSDGFPICANLCSSVSNYPQSEHVPTGMPAAITHVAAAGQRLRLRYWISEEAPRLLVVAGGRPLAVWLLTQAAAEQFVPPGGWQYPGSPASGSWDGGIALHPSPPSSLPQGQRGAVAPIIIDATYHPVLETTAEEGWRPITEPAALERLGCDYGYGWYRAELELDAPLDTTLLAPALADRATLLVDGAPAGVLGVDPGGASFALPLRLAAGRHDLRLLADNLGRFNYGSGLGELKGLTGTLYLGGAQHDISRGWTALWQEAVFAGEALAGAHPAAARADATDVDLGNFAFEGPSVWLLREFAARAGHRTLLYLTGDRNPGALFVNGVNIERFSRHRSGGLIKHDISAQVRPGTNVIALNIQGYAGAAWRALLLEYDPERPLPARWSFRPGITPDLAQPAPARETGAGPAFYRATFGRERLAAASGEPPQGLRMRIHGPRKGQIWLNGQNVGRYWHTGPQEDYKLPVSWLRDENELLVFAEHACPTSVSLQLERP